MKWMGIGLVPRAILAGLLIVGCSSGGGGGDDPDYNLAGLWDFHVAWDNGTNADGLWTLNADKTFHITFTTSGGTYNVSGSDIRFKFDMGTEYWGSISSANHMSGKCRSNSGAEGSWDATLSARAADRSAPSGGVGDATGFTL